MVDKYHPVTKRLDSADSQQLYWKALLVSMTSMAWHNVVKLNAAVLQTTFAQTRIGSFWSDDKTTTYYSLFKSGGTMI